MTTAKATVTYAKLIRGATFIYNGKIFRSGTPAAVSAEEMAYLQEHAVDLVDRPGDIDGETEQEVRQKFTFAEGPA